MGCCGSRDKEASNKSIILNVKTDQSEKECENFQIEYITSSERDSLIQLETKLQIQKRQFHQTKSIDFNDNGPCQLIKDDNYQEIMENNNLSSQISDVEQPIRKRKRPFTQIRRTKSEIQKKKKIEQQQNYNSNKNIDCQQLYTVNYWYYYKLQNKIAQIAQQSQPKITICEQFQQIQNQYSHSKSDQNSLSYESDAEDIQQYCLNCKCLIADDFIQLKCLHSYHQQCFFHIIQVQQEQLQAKCLCQEIIKTSTLQTLMNGQNEFQEKYFKQQYNYLYEKYKNKIENQENENYDNENYNNENQNEQEQRKQIKRINTQTSNDELIEIDL